MTKTCFGLIALLSLVIPSLAPAQVRSPAGKPDFTVEIFGEPVTDFGRRVNAYFEVRAQLERNLPAVVVTEDVAQIRRGSRTLARAIRVSRPGAVEGEFFTPTASADFKLELALVMTADVWDAIMDENPGAFRYRVGGAYPDGKTHSTVPGVILAQLPQLPKDVEFRFIGPHLILYDVRANTIIDRLPYAIVCIDCDH